MSQRTSALDKGREQHIVSRLSMDLKRNFSLRVFQASSWYIPNVNKADDIVLREVVVVVCPKSILLRRNVRLFEQAYSQQAEK